MALGPRVARDQLWLLWSELDLAEPLLTAPDDSTPLDGAETAGPGSDSRASKRLRRSHHASSDVAPSFAAIVEPICACCDKQSTGDSMCEQPTTDSMCEQSIEPECEQPIEPGFEQPGAQSNELRWAHRLSLREPIVQVSCGEGFVLALSARARVLSYGNNFYGQLGRARRRCRGQRHLAPISLRSTDEQERTGINLVASSLSSSSFSSSSSSSSSSSVQFPPAPSSASIDRLCVGPVDERSYDECEPRVRSIAAGVRHSLACTEDGRVYAWGWNTSSQCGLPACRSVDRPACVPGLNHILKVAAGREHSLFLALGHNRVYACGSNAQLQCAQESSQLRVCPACVVPTQHLSAPVCSLSCGWAHNLLLTSTGQVYSFGWGSHMQLGHDTVDDLSTPTPISHRNVRDCAEVSAGAWSSLFRTRTGHLYLCGWLGPAEKVFRKPTQLRLPSESNVLYIASGTRHVSAVCEAASTGRTSLVLFGRAATSPRCVEHAPAPRCQGGKSLSVCVELGEGHDRVQGIAAAGWSTTVWSRDSPPSPRRFPRQIRPIA